MCERVRNRHKAGPSALHALHGCILRARLKRSAQVALLNRWARRASLSISDSKHKRLKASIPPLALAIIFDVKVTNVDDVTAPMPATRSNGTML